MSEERNLYISDNLGKKRSKRGTDAHRYAFELVTIDMDMKEGRKRKAQLSRAVDDTLLFVHPRLSYTGQDSVIPAGGLTVNGVNNAGSKTISVNGSGSWRLSAGDYIQWSNDSKVYEVAEDTLLTPGIKSVQLTFPLRKNLVASSAIVTSGVTWYLSSDGVIEIETQANDNQDISIVLKAVEQL